MVRLRGRLVFVLIRDGGGRGSRERVAGRVEFRVLGVIGELSFVCGEFLGGLSGEVFVLV